MNADAGVLLPALAAQQRDRRPWPRLTLLLEAVGFAAFACTPELVPHTFDIISGVGLGGWFAMTLVVALDHLPDHERADAGWRLSACHLVTVVGSRAT